MSEHKHHMIDPHSRDGIRQASVEKIKKEWESDRWNGIERGYSAEEVAHYRGTLQIQYTLADHTAKKLWRYLAKEDYVNALGALTGNQAVQMVAGGLKSIYLSGWQVAGDANLAMQMYPDQSLYPANSAPAICKRINNALMRADQVSMLDDRKEEHLDWFQPIVADAEAGFGGVLNAYELMREFIEAGAAGVHFEDQLSSAKKCGHMGGKVLVPTQEFVSKLKAARLAADVCGVPTVLIARTDADSAKLLTSDIDERDQKFCTGDRTEEGFFRINGGLDCAIDRGLSYAPYCDMIWCETSTPDLDDAKKFAEAIHAKFPGKYLAYNCSPSFNWRRNLDEATIAKFQRELGAMGYKYQFVTLAGFHALNLSMFKLALGYKAEGMAAYSRLQEEEFELERTKNYRAVKHQRFVGAGFFDNLSQTVTGNNNLSALDGSTEEAQFEEEEEPAAAK